MKLIVALIFLAIVALGAWTFRPKTTIAPGDANGEQVMCTMDAMQCPDGSWVGRTGPNCEFVCSN